MGPAGPPALGVLGRRLGSPSVMLRDAGIGGRGFEPSPGHGLVATVTYKGEGGQRPK